ncbi:MAG: TerC family protein [Chlamydiae bacterium]|nr:TerC family protein [Chlamydiota bacterium]MBI3266267.1 TerC family protein [Chlamydiota bacterium]
MFQVDLFLWALFGFLVCAALSIDLFIANRRDSEISIREAGFWVLIWVALALVFDGVVFYLKGSGKALEFLTGYVVEESLSVDNLFVFVMIFSHFRVKSLHQPRVLKWGILGAVVMRAFFVATGVTLFNLFHWMIYVFGGLLIFAALKILFDEESEFEPDRNWAVRFFRLFMPVSTQSPDQKFFIKENGKWFATPLFIVLILIETSDLIFALDSVPAVIGISRDLFIVYSSNIFAILGLRALYFMLAGVMDLFRFLKIGICVILTFVGIKLMISRIFEIPTGFTLALIALVLTVSVAASLIFKEKKK